MNPQALVAPMSVETGDGRVGRSTFRTLVPAAATDGRYSIVYVDNDPGFGPPLHVHANEDEIFHLVDGTIRVVCDGVVRDLAAPVTVMLPRGVPHAYVATGPNPARMIITCVPGGFDQFFADIAGMDLQTEMEELVRISAEYGITYVGPPLAA